MATVRTIEEAAVLADVFAAASYDAEKKDDFFAKSGRDLVANYLFAAAVNGNYLSVVFDWLSRSDNPTPARVLQDRYPSIADDIESTQALVEETRSGVYEFAQGVMRFLASEALRACVTPTAGLTEFKPEEFSAAPADTLYLLSEEGPPPPALSWPHSPARCSPPPRTTPSVSRPGAVRCRSWPCSMRPETSAVSPICRPSTPTTAREA